MKGPRVKAEQPRPRAAPSAAPALTREAAALRRAGPAAPDAVLGCFWRWLHGTGLTPWPHQQRALSELFAERHVVLQSPTGSGKSLVALGLHFKALCEGRRSIYTAPIKALVSEKFFQLCEIFGAEQVGMLTGDASINRAAPVICCTQEVLANMALREGPRCDAPYAVLDEFHYYGDRERGHAWQAPLLALPNTAFLLMSATLGDTAAIERRLRAFSGRAVSHVHSEQRPVPLDFDYRETPLHETVEALLDEKRAPIYLVSFTQREAAQTASALTSARVASPGQRSAIAAALRGFRFDSPYGREVRRILSHGVGLHHAGILPKYRLLVEQLAQRGLLRVISGTDTLGVGVNIPIRSVLFTRLFKFDGEKFRLLQVREFKQIAGRAGRQGFDRRGSVICQAPPHATRSRRRRFPPRARRRAAPGRGEGAWDRRTFAKLIKSPPEALVSQFRITHGMLVDVLQRDASAEPRGGYGALAAIIGRCHEPAPRKRQLLREAAELFRSLRRAGVIALRAGRVHVAEELRRDFSMHQTLALFLFETCARLDSRAPAYPLQVLSCIEAVLPNPEAILRQQVRVLRDELRARLRAKGVPFRERNARLARVSHAVPDPAFLAFLSRGFRSFAAQHPWVNRESLHPKAIAREMIERGMDFYDVVRRYRLQRMEGTLLRYLGEVLTTLARSVPQLAESAALQEMLRGLRDMLRRVDSSLLREWESLVAEAPGGANGAKRRR